MRFWNHYSQQFYDMYVNLFDSDFTIDKKKIILHSLFSGEYCLWRVVGISKMCFEQYKKNNFKKVTKIKRANKKFIRFQFSSFNDSELLNFFVGNPDATAIILLESFFIELAKEYFSTAR